MHISTTYPGRETRGGLMTPQPDVTAPVVAAHAPTGLADRVTELSDGRTVG